MSKYVLDASALLALLNAEPGAETVSEAIADAVISAVNLSEVVARLCEEGMPAAVVRQTLSLLSLEVAAFDEAQAYQAGDLRAATRSAGLSLGDQACLGLADKLGAPALTADRTWLQLSLGVQVQLIR